MNQLFLELTIILIAAGFIAYLLHFFKQPSIVAYIITGLLIGPFALYRLQHPDILHALADVGITLLLFMVGLDLDISQFKKIGKTAVIAGVGQVIFTSVIGFAIVSLLGFSWIPALYIAIALTFSSTIIAFKLLSEKKDMQSLYGKIAVGIFLIQDVAAIAVLIILASGSGNSASILTGDTITQNIVFTLGKAFMIGIVVIAISRVVFPKLIRSLQKSDELLLLFSLGWALGLAAFFSSPLVGFNAAIGGFVAGLALANSSTHFQIGARIKPLRDFFIIIFFIVLGSQLVFSHIREAIWPSILLSFFVLVGKPVIVIIILKSLGYKLRTAFLVGITVSQVSEFSLILMSVGLVAGHINETVVTVITLVAITTISISSYGILYADQIYEKFISKFERFFGAHNKKLEQTLENVVLKNHIVIVGAHRLGAHIINWLHKEKQQFLIVDYNPDVVAYYTEQGMLAVCGDIADPYIQDIANLRHAAMVICTVPDYHDTLALIEAIRNNKRKKVKLIVTAADEQEAISLYQAKADYVLLPHFVGGVHLTEIVAESGNSKNLLKLKDRHLKTLNKYLLKVKA